MAKAPKPGVTARAEDQAENAKILTIEIKRELDTGGKKPRPIPQTNTLAVNLIPMRERIICRKATGLPFSAFWSEDRIDVDSIVVLWWMARRANGEVTLTFDQAAEQWPTDLDFETEVELELDDPDEEADDPEA